MRSSSFKIFLIIASVIAPMQCATCRFSLDEESAYGCELSDVIFTNETGIFEITGEHLPGFSDTNVTWMNTTDSVILSFFPSQIFENFSRIREVDFSRVEMEGIGLNNEECRMIRRMRLEGNMIERVTKESFESCWFMQYLHLSGNGLNTIEDYAFSRLRFLRELDLSHNSLTTISETAFSNLSLLQNVYLNDNKLVELPDNLFAIRANIQHINLDNNLFVKISPKLFAQQNLRYLSINNNLIESLGDMQSGPDLNFFFGEFHVNNNRIKSLEMNPFINRGLRIFSASGNNITSIHPNTFNRNFSAADQRIVQIDLSHNNLKEIISGTFHSLIGLFSLRLNSNQLSSLPNDFISGCPIPCWGLTIFDASDNQLEVIHSELFVEMSRVQDLNLSSNKISAIDRNTLQRLPIIRNLFLSDNLCSDSDFEDLSRDDIPQVNESLEECFANFDGLN